jgi:hypothetical protein
VANGETGVWEEDADPDPDANLPIFRTSIPGFAIAPDGSELAVVSATNESIALVDTTPLKVKRTITMHNDSSVVDKLFALLPLAPQSASAKGNSGVARFASYSADGKHLYISGWEGHYDLVENQQFMHGQGLNVVDLKDGAIAAHLLDGVSVYQVVETPESGVYVAGYDYNDNNLSGTVIAHVDSRHREVMAKRTFDDYIAFVVAPVPSN